MASPSSAIEKIYRLKGEGAPALIKDLTTINKLFQEIAKSKRELMGQKADIDDPARLAQIEKELESLTAQEIELTKQKRTRLEAAREELVSNSELIGSYNELKAAVSGINSGNASAVAGGTGDQAAAVQNVAAAQERLAESTAKVTAARDGVSAALARGRLEEQAVTQSTMTEAEAQAKLNAEYEELMLAVKDADAALAEMRAQQQGVNMVQAEGIISLEQFVAAREAAREALAAGASAAEADAAFTKSLNDAIAQNAVVTTEAADPVLRLSERIVQLGVESQDVAAKMKALTKTFTSGAISEEDFLARGGKLIDQQAALGVELGKANAELKSQTQYQLATANSIDEWRAKVAQLTKERNGLNLMTAQGTVRQGELNAKIDEYNALIKQSVDQYQKQKINIGNYPTATAELSAIRQQLVQMKLAGDADSVTFKELETRAQQLAVAIGEVNAATRANTAAMGEEAATTRTTAQAIGLKLEKAVALENIAGRLITSFTRMGIHFLAFTLIFKGIEYVIDKVTELANHQSEAEKVATSYNKALADATSESAAQVASLVGLQELLNSNTAARVDQLAALTKERDALGEYIGLINDEDIGTQKVNTSIEAQISLIRQRDAVKAGETAVSEALKKQQAAEAALNEVLNNRLGFFDKLKGPAENYAITLKDLARANGDLKSAEDLLADAQNGNVAANRKLVAELDAAISEYQKLERQAQANLSVSGKNHAIIQKEIDLYASLVTQLEAVRKAKIEQLNIVAPPPQADDPFKQQAAIDQARILSEKKNSKAELDAKKIRMRRSMLFLWSIPLKGNSGPRICRMRPGTRHPWA
jgi:hypothetical protein